MVTAAERLRGPAIRVVYDRAADVLHVVAGEPMPYEGDGLPRGIELDYTLDSGKPVGAKVIGFERYGWRIDTKELATIIAHHLRISPRTVREAIQNSIEDS